MKMLRELLRVYRAALLAEEYQSLWDAQRALRSNDRLSRDTRDQWRDQAILAERKIEKLERKLNP